MASGVRLIEEGDTVFLRQSGNKDSILVVKKQGYVSCFYSFDYSVVRETRLCKDHVPMLPLIGQPFGSTFAIERGSLKRIACEPSRDEGDETGLVMR